MSQKPAAAKKRKAEDLEVGIIDDEVNPLKAFVNNKARDPSNLLDARILVLVSDCGQLNQVTVQRDLNKKRQPYFNIGNVDQLVYNHFVDENDHISILQKKDILSLLRLDSDDIEYYKNVNYDSFYFDNLPEKLTPKQWSLDDHTSKRRFSNNDRAPLFFEEEIKDNTSTLTIVGQGVVFGALLPHFIRLQASVMNKPENIESEIYFKKNPVNKPQKKGTRNKKKNNNNNNNDNNNSDKITLEDWNMVKKPKVYFTRVTTLRKCISNSSEETSKFIRENFDYIVLTHNMEGHKMKASTPLLAQGLSENEANFQDRLLDWLSSKIIVHGVKCFPPMSIANFLRDKMLVKNAIPKNYRLPHYAFYFPIDLQEEIARKKAVNIMMKETIQLLNNDMNRDKVTVSPIVEQIIESLTHKYGKKRRRRKRVNFQPESEDESAGCPEEEEEERTANDPDDELASTDVTWMQIFKRVSTYFDELYQDVRKKREEKKKQKG